MTANLDPRAHQPGATIKPLNSQVKNRSVELAARRRSRFSPECEVAHTLPRNVSRRVAGPGDGEGTGRWPPEDPPFVKSANGGAWPSARKKWHFGNGATKDTSSAGSLSWSALAIIAGSNPSIPDPTRSWMKRSNGNTTSSRNRGQWSSARCPTLPRLQGAGLDSNYSGRAETCAD